MGLLKIGLIGIGNFGGQVCEEAVKHDFPAVVINSSTKDLDELNDKIVKFVVGDGNGTGKNRELGRDFLMDHIGFTQDKNLIEFLENNDCIYIAASSGGGMGSGAGPVTADVIMQMYTDDLGHSVKMVGMISTLPDLDESYTAQKNSEEFMRDLLDLHVPYLMYDNNNFNNLTVEEMNKKVVSNIIADMRVLRGDFILPCTTGGIDQRDLLTLNSTPGRIVVDRIEPFDESDIVDDSIVGTIRKHISKSAHAALVDDKIILASGIMYNLSADTIKYASTVKKELQNTFGEHIADFRNESANITQEDDFVVTILAGLTEPTTRIDKGITRRLKIESTIAERKSASTKLNSVQTGGLSLGVKSFGSGMSTARTNKPDIGGILKKYRDKEGTSTSNTDAVVAETTTTVGSSNKQKNENTTLSNKAGKE